MTRLTTVALQEPEFQLEPLPKTNPRLEGVRWKQYHKALDETLENLPEESWQTVKEEKAADMIHILDFPYNGEPRESAWSHRLSQRMRTSSCAIMAVYPESRPMIGIWILAVWYRSHNA